MNKENISEEHSATTADEMAKLASNREANFNALAKNSASIASAMKAVSDQVAGYNLNNTNIAATMKAVSDQVAGYNLNNTNIAAIMKAVSDQIAGYNLATDGSSIAQAMEILRLQSGNLSAARALGYKPLKEDHSKRVTVYSNEMTSHSSYFEQSELEVGSFDELLSAIRKLCKLHPEFTFLWRGQRDADWPLHSSLFRALWQVKTVRAPNQSHRSTEPFPTEEDMVAAETAILATVREDWRFEDLGALSTFARLQHFGAPTRLLDVSRNPLIAAWFATEQSEETDDQDCRIFALATGTLPSDETERSRQKLSSRLESAEASSSLPFWHALEDESRRSEYEWGTGRVRRFWIPPLYESRIAAQNAGFILDGVPLASPDQDKHFHKTNSDLPWTYGDRLASASITTRFSRPNKRIGNRIATALPPSFTFRVTARAKHEIRKVLNEDFSYNYATIYPDIQGAAMAMGARLQELFVPR